MTKRQTTEPTLDEHGYEIHPSWAVIGASRGSFSPPGVALFDSEIRHQHAVTIRIMEASRSRHGQHDYINGAGGKVVAEVTLSEAQWASFVSSMNMGDGVPCTLRMRDSDYQVPDAPYEPRLALTMAQAKGAAEEAFKDVVEALEEYERLVSEKAPARERKEAYSTLYHRIKNAAPNIEYAGKVLAGHAEDVVMKARADLEAYVVKAAQTLGVDASTLSIEMPIAPQQELES